VSRGFRFDEAVADVYGDLRLAPVLRRLLRHLGRPAGSVAGSVSLIDADREILTSLGVAGASLTLMRLDDEIEGLLSTPAEAAVRVF